MNDEDEAFKLHLLPGQSFAGAVRQHLLRIERQVHLGKTQAQIYAEIDYQGVPLDTFRRSLQRARAWLRSDLGLLQGIPKVLHTQAAQSTAPPQPPLQQRPNTMQTRPQPAIPTGETRSVSPEAFFQNRPRKSIFPKDTT